MLRVHNVSFAYGNDQVLHHIDLQVQPGEIMCLLGPSGCGKTTLLRLIAGLETPQSGDILFNDAVITRLPPHERDFGLMFQDYALFPHMNVAENVLFGLRMHRIPKDEAARRLTEVLALVELEGFERRRVTEISGGERQRVALARSLAPRPRLLMLDEPLGSLDAALREQLVVQLRAIIKRAGLTSIYVTHDQQEAFAIADRIAVMQGGCIEQVDTPLQIYLRPRTVFVARFLGLENIIPVTDARDGLVRTPLGDFPCNWRAEDRSLPDALLIHPGGIRLVAGTAVSPYPTLSGTVQRCVFAGDSYRVTVEPQGYGEIALTFRVPVTETPADSSGPHCGEQVTITCSPDLIMPLWASMAC